MVNQTNILAILPAPTIGNAPLAGGIANLGDSTFQNYIKDAVQESSSSARENKPATENERADRAPSAEPNRSDRPENRPADQPARPHAEKAPDTNYQERAAVGGATDQGQAYADDKNHASESIDPRELKVGQAYMDINALLQSLARQLNLNPGDLIVELSTDPLAQQQKLLSLLQGHGGQATHTDPLAQQQKLLSLLQGQGGQATHTDPLAQQQKLLSLLQGQGGQAAELLVKAGLTEQQAQNLSAKIQSVQGNQATLQANKEGADEVLVKLGGERSAEGKADFLSQFSDINKQGEKPQRQASIEKVLTQSANDPVKELSQKLVEKNITTAQKLEEIFQSPNNQSNLHPAQNGAANNPPKNIQGLKAPTEVQVQSVNAASESAARAVEGAKSVSAESLSTKGTTEARVINQIINKVSLRSNGSQSEMKIRLDPPSLGTIRMNVTTAGNSVRMVVIAESHAVKQIIENNLIQLRDSMQGQGLKVDSFTVLVGGNEGQGGQQNTSHEGRSNFAGFPYAEQNIAPETPAENSAAGRPRILNYDSQSLSVFA